MKAKSNDSMLMLGIALVIVAGILFAYANMQPKVYEDSPVVASNELQEESSTKTQYPINLNEATAEELMTIDGLGAKKANMIIQYRDSLGGFTSVEQIKNVYGISEAVYASIAEYLTV